MHQHIVFFRDFFYISFRANMLPLTDNNVETQNIMTSRNKNTNGKSAQESPDENRETSLSNFEEMMCANNDNGKMMFNDNNDSCKEVTQNLC